MSNGIDLAQLNWGSYNLIAIDESHNFRNGGKIRTDEDDVNFFQVVGNVSERCNEARTTACCMEVLGCSHNGAFTKAY